MIVQKLKRPFTSNEELIKVYYSMLSAFNGLELTNRDLELLTFTSLKEGLKNKEEFVEKVGTSVATMRNTVSKLKKMGLLVKENGMVTVHSSISPKVKDGIILEMRLVYEE